MKKIIAVMLCMLILAGSAASSGENGMSVTAPDGPVCPGEASVIRYNVPADGEYDLVIRDDDGNEISVVSLLRDSAAGENSLYWNGTFNGEDCPPGNWQLCIEKNGRRAQTPIAVVLRSGAEAETADTDDAEDSGVSGPAGETEEETPSADDAEPVETEHVTIPEEVIFTPCYGSPYEGQDASLNYWTLPMDITDEEAIWQVLTAPITVLDKGKQNSEKTQVAVREEPSEDSEGLGVVTCETQSVHVLERGEEWSLIECYSSSFHDSAYLNWNTLIQGYVPTRYLKEVKPNQKLGFVIDKLTQRLYIFREGHLFTTLLVSTGLSNERQPYNETRSGEFLLTSKVGEFMSDNIHCAMAIRFNKGDLLHEVPYTLYRDKSRNYKNCEPKLGTKASHGCIRVQRNKTPEGVNMNWIWTNLKANSKVKLLLWEDWQGRQIPVPSDDLKLYYNPAGGESYHSADHCYSIKKKNVTMESFTYAELDTEPYAHLTRCEYCTPVLRKAEIDAINEVYAWGGDHDPVLTEARKTCPRKLKKK